MAEEVTIEGQQFKKRSPIGVWLLSLVTIGIYGYVWYYKINDEARRYLQDDSIKPAYSVLAFIPGVLLLYIPPLVSLYGTGGRVQRMQERAGAPGKISAVLCVILLFLLATYPIYIQSALNQTWDAARSRPATA